VKAALLSVFNCKATPVPVEHKNLNSPLSFIISQSSCCKSVKLNFGIVDCITTFPVIVAFVPKVISEPVSVILESFKDVPSNLTTLFVTIFVGSNCVADTLPLAVTSPFSVIANFSTLARVNLNLLAVVPIANCISYVSAT
jgi:hypothetical protein